MRSFSLSRLILAWLCVMAGFPGAVRLHAQQSSGAQDDAEIVTAPVTVDGTTLFRVRGVSSLSADARAQRIRAALVSVAADPAIAVDAVQAVEADGATLIQVGGVTIAGVLEADARLEQVRRVELGTAHLARIRQAISDYRTARSLPALRRALWHVLLASVVLVAGLLMLFWFWGRLDEALKRRLEARVRLVESKSFELMRAEQIWEALRKAALTVRLIALLAIVLVYLGYLLGQFPGTRGLSQNLAAFVLGPLDVMGGGIVASVPGLVFLVVLFVVVRVVLRLIRLFFDLLGRGGAHIVGFDPDWAEPTYKIVRVAVIAFALIVAFPYIPGSNTDAFRGVSLFVGVLFSLGSSSAISNIIAGYMLTYRRALKVGDRVKIGSAMGDVIEMRMQVTHLRSFKNEEIILPNSQILTSEVVNFSSISRERGLILHSEVGIGYETPWRQVEAMLLDAAARTEGLLKEPRPFVFMKQLGDFAVTYEINAFTFEVKSMVRIYTALHGHILDIFNEHGVQIMTPAYEGDPESPKVVPVENFYTAPATRSDGAAVSDRGRSR
jgi:small-conductance mechanosensitive channel